MSPSPKVCVQMFEILVRNIFKIMSWWTHIYLYTRNRNFMKRFLMVQLFCFLLYSVSSLLILISLYKIDFFDLLMAWNPFSWKHYGKTTRAFQAHIEHLRIDLPDPLRARPPLPLCPPLSFPLLKQRWLWLLFLLSHSHPVHSSASPFLFLAFYLCFQT